MKRGLMAWVVALAIIGNAYGAEIYAVFGPGSGSFTAGETIEFTVMLDDDVDSVSGSPYLVLSGIQNVDSTERRACFAGIVQYRGVPSLRFSYIVKPGDFSTGVGIESFQLNGATVATDDGNLTVMTLPSGCVLQSEMVTISTITFTESGATTFAATGTAGSVLNVGISLGGEATTNHSFTASASTTGKVYFTSPFTIPAGSSSGTCQLGLGYRTDGAMTITFHPTAYTGADGDLVLTLTIVEEEKPYIAAVLNDGEDRTYTVGDAIDLAVKIAIPGQENVTITSVTGNPYIRLSIQNQDTSDKRATYTGEFYNDMIFFQYVVQPGDFAEDLDCVQYGFVLNGAEIIVDDGTENGATLSRSGYRAMPVGTASGSLSQNADISIRTIMLDDYTFTRSLSGREGDTCIVEITRREPLYKVQGFTMTPSVARKIGLPATFSIPHDEESATLSIDLVDATTEPLTLRIHPNGYSTDAGDIVLTINIAEGPPAPIYITGPSQLEEGQGIATITVSLSRPPIETTTISISAAPDGKLEFLSSTSLTWAPGDQTARNVIVWPLDDDANVTIMATPNNRRFSAATITTFVGNVNPSLVNPPPNGWEPPTGAEGVPYLFAWSGTDVEADKDSLYTVVWWGDGTINKYNGAQGTASHTYTVPGLFDIVVELHDKDGGVATATGTASIQHSAAGIRQHVETGVPLAWIMPNPLSASWSIVGGDASPNGPCLRSDPTGASESAIIEATLSGAGLLTFDWRVSAHRGHYARFYIDGVLAESITRLTDWSTVSAILDDGVHVLRWTYEKGSGATANEDAAFLDNVCWQPLSLSKALEGTNIVWTSDGDAVWVPQVGVTYDGIDAARSGKVIGMQSSRIAATVTGAGTLSWAWKASVAGIAGVDVFLDGEVLYDDGIFLDGPSDWSAASIEIQGSGEHIITFEFWNCGTESTIDDCAYLDCVTWVPAVSKNVVVGNVEIPVSWLNEKAASFVAVNAGDYESAAKEDAANGVNKVWECYVAGLVPTNAADMFRTVISMENGEPVIGWEPDLNEGGTKHERVYTVEGRESLTEGSWGPTNAASRFFRVKVSMP